MARYQGPRLDRQKNGIWVIRYWDGQHTRSVSTRTRDREEAEQVLAGFLLESTSGRPMARMTVGEAWKLYESRHVDVNVAKPDIAKGIWRKHFEHRFSKSVIADLRPEHFIQYAQDRQREGAAVNTVRHELGLVRAAINYARKLGRLPASSVPHIPLPDAAPPKQRWLTAEEIDHLIAVAAQLRRGSRLSRAERFIHLALGTAARRRAIETLEWSQVDFDRRMIDYGPGNGRKRRATVPISDRLLPVLQRAYRERKSWYVLDNTGSVYGAVRRVLREAGLDDVTPHTFRHTFATHAVMAGMPMADVARVLGNSTAMVERVYAKYAPEYLRDVVNVEPVRLGPVSTAAQSRRKAEND